MLDARLCSAKTSNLNTSNAPKVIGGLRQIFSHSFPMESQKEGRVRAYITHE